MEKNPFNFLFFFDSCNATTCRPGNDTETCPKYDGKFLAEKTRELLQDKRLVETLTNVVITSFDQKNIRPVIFSNYKVSMV